MAAITFMHYVTVQRHITNPKVKALTEIKLRGEKGAHAISLYTQISFHNFILQREEGGKEEMKS